MHCHRPAGRPSRQQRVRITLRTVPIMASEAEDLEALFDSIAQSHMASSAGAEREAAGAGDSEEDLEALFDSIAEQQVVQAAPAPAPAPVSAAMDDDVIADTEEVAD